MSSEQRVAIVTGAANGIGKATAEAFAGAGYHVVAWDLAALAGETPVDVSDPESVEAAVARVMAAHGRIDVLINNAGILRDGLLVKVKDGEVVKKLSPEQFDAVIAVNLRGVFTCTS